MTTPDAPINTSTPTTTSTTTTWTLDPAHTLVEFSAKHMMVTTVRGSFTSVRGTIQADEDSPHLSAVDIEIDAASLDTHQEMRDNHLRSPDFLDVATYPHITFKSTRIEQRDAEHGRITGDLTIKDTTREVTLDATFNGRGKNPMGREIASFSAETTINRKDFGLNWNMALETGGWLVGDTIKIVIEIEAIKQV